MENSSNKNRTPVMSWDNSIIDQLLHVVSPLLLVSVAVVMIVAAISAGELKREFTCQFPAEFMPSEQVYGLASCKSGLYPLYKPPNELIPSHSDRSEVLKLPPIPQGYKQILNWYTMECFLLAMLCILPFTAWSLFGKADGLGILQISHANKAPSMTQSVGSLAWYAITRIAAALVSIASCVILSMNYGSPEPAEWSRPQAYLCEYEYRRLGRHSVAYTVPCIHSIPNGDMDPSKLTWLRNVLFMWFAGLSVVLALNAIFIIIVSIISFVHAFRKRILHKMVGMNAERTSNIFISPHQAFVIVMASRNGYGQLVSDTLNTLTDNLISKLD